VATHHKVYRFRMRPNAVQERALNRMAGARRFVWNWALRRWKDHYAATGKSIPLAQLSAELTALKQQPATAWLKEADSQSLQQTLKDLHRAFGSFFEKRSRSPRFKSRKRDKARFRIPQRVRLVKGRVIIPKIGGVRAYQSRPVEEQTKSATFRRSADGKWYVSLVAEFEMPDVALPPPDPARTVGVDVGLIDYATFSDDTAPVPAPKFFRKAQRKLKRAQRKVSRCSKGSRRKAKAARRVAMIHRDTASRRGDFQHKLSTRIVRGHDAVCTEDLSLRGLARTKLAKSFADAGLGEFKRQLEYKCLWNRRHFVTVDRFFPSSKMCNVCGVLNDRLTLSDREWDCVCGAHHKRDFLAACNIRDEGLRILAAGHAESQNARGVGVRPVMHGQSTMNRESHAI
jgi:putative transposase